MSIKNRSISLERWCCETSQVKMLDDAGKRILSTWQYSGSVISWQSILAQANGAKVIPVLATAAPVTAA